MSQVIIVVFDLNSMKSFEEAIKWTTELKEQKMTVWLVGNLKYGQRVINKKEVKEFLSSNDLRYYEISAKSGYGVGSLLRHITDYILYKKSQPQTTEIIDYDSRCLACFLL